MMMAEGGGEGVSVEQSYRSMESESLRRRSSPPSSPADDFIQIEETMAAKQPDNMPVTAGRGGTTTGGELRR